MKSLETQYIKAEVRQRREEGCDIGDISDRVDAALEAKAGQSEMTALYDELMSLPVDESFPYTEPSTLDAIRAERYEGERSLRCRMVMMFSMIVFMVLGWVVLRGVRLVSPLRVGRRSRLISF